MKKTTIFLLVLSLFIFFANKVKAGNEYCTNPANPVCYDARSYSEYNCVAAPFLGRFCTTAVGDGPFESCGDDTYCAIWHPGTTCRPWYTGGGGNPTLNSGGHCNLVLSALATCNTSPGHCDYTINNYVDCNQQCADCGCSESAPYTKVYGCCGPGDATTPPTSPPTSPPGSCECPQDTYPNCFTHPSCNNCVAPAICDSPTCGGGTCHYPGASCSGAQPQSVSTTKTYGDFYVYAYGVQNASAVQFWVWTDANGKDDMVKYTGVDQGGGTWRATVNLASHTGVGLIHVEVYMVDYYGELIMCGTANFNRLNPVVSWWRVKDSDILANGDVTSTIPSPLYFDIVGGGGFPGVPMYRDTSNLTSTNVSNTKWIAKSPFVLSKKFNSEYFINAIPAAATINTITSNSEPISFFASGGTAYNGYYYYVYEAASPGLSFTITTSANTSIGSRKVILIIKGANLNIASNINRTVGSGFFLAVTTGNIVIDPTVGGGAQPNLEGIFVADGTVSTGTVIF